MGVVEPNAGALDAAPNDMGVAAGVTPNVLPLVDDPNTEPVNDGKDGVLLKPGADEEGVRAAVVDGGVPNRNGGGEGEGEGESVEDIDAADDCDSRGGCPNVEAVNRF